MQQELVRRPFGARFAFIHPSHLVINATGTLWRANNRSLSTLGHFGWSLGAYKQVARKPKFGIALMIRLLSPKCVKPDSHVVTGVARFSPGSCSRGGVPPCRLAAEGVPVQELIGRGGRDFSSRGFSRCCSCDRFVASSATTVFSDGLSAPIPVHPRLEGHGCHWFEDAEAALKV